MSDLKQKYLDTKYAEYDDESDIPYKHKRVKHHTKKSNHKHEYENIVIVDTSNPDSFKLISRCTICGKVNGAKKDERIEKKFPHITYAGMLWLIGCRLGYEEEYEEFKDWCKKHYTVIDAPEFDGFRTKYI